MLCLFAFCNQIFFPAAAFALTGHESMPEYRSFEPVASNNLVSMSDGSFTYNIPLLDVPNGYPINLSYHSNDVNTEALASWVGLGWSLNPGAINRIKQGFPDEFDGETVRYHNRMPANKTASVKYTTGLEGFGNEKTALSAGASLTFNNYTGIGSAIDANIMVPGVASLSFQHSPGNYGFGGSVKPLKWLNPDHAKSRKSNPKQARGSDGEESLEVKEKGNKKLKNLRSRAARFNVKAPTPATYPTSVSKYTGFMAQVKTNVGVNWLPMPVDAEAGLSGSFAWQRNQAITDRKVYGYQHSEEAVKDDHKEAMMDYMTENESPFEPRDNILGYPLPNYDQYILSGEGVGGSFRAFRSEYGHYRKNYIRSEDFSANAGIDVNAPSVVGILPPLLISNIVSSQGAEVGGNYHWTSIGSWKKQGDAENYAFSNLFSRSGEKTFFRMTHDPAGYFDLTARETLVAGDDKPGKAHMDFNTLPQTIQLDFSTVHPNGSTGGPVRADYRRQTDEIGPQYLSKNRSTNIEQHSNKDFSAETNLSTGNYKYRVYEKNIHLVDNQGNVNAYDHTDYQDKSPGEMVVHSNEGATYVYGLPVNARREKNLQYHLKQNEDFDVDDLANIGGGQIAQVTQDIDESADRKLGFESDAAYPTSHLLTQVLDANYIDRTANGPTTDDFGNYARFNYTQIAGGQGSNGNDWYSFRTPFTGVSYNHGSLSTRKDDMGSFSYGEKEVFYLQSVASKTHVAIFTLGERKDGLSAALPNNPDADDLIKGSDGQTAPKSLKRLERIDLYALKDCVPADPTKETGIYKPVPNALPIKTVHFEYDYELCKGVPNQLDAGQGKLTLKKIWFEYNGKLTSKIAPYRFDYKDFAGDYPARYEHLKTGNSAASQNPEYHVLNTDRWGSYRDFTALKNNLGGLAQFWPFTNQQAPADFDPAAWCLKRIIMPSGGELHVQYEQADYQFVQDQRVMMMVPLSNQTDRSEQFTGDKRYYLDLDKVGVSIDASLTNAERLKIAEDLFAPMAGPQKHRLYFNFLYALVGNEPDYRYTHSDYLEGYARINGFGVDAKGIYFTFKGGPSNDPDFKTIAYSSRASQREMPNKVCRDFYRNQRRGIVDGNANAMDSEDENAEGIVKALAEIGQSLADYTVASKCRKMDPEMSYVRIQVPANPYVVKKKRGGGIRVKRLLTYAPRMVDNALRVLYGSTYEYTDYLNPDDPSSPLISSGVATNEPAQGRKESPLVNVIPKDEQHWLSALAFGRDIYGQEGPIGEQLLPAPSIGYSRIVVRNIHEGATAPGYSISQFYTVRDFPMEVEYTAVEKDLTFPINLPYSRQATSTSPGLNINFSFKTPHLAQGFVFKNYAMHGKPKSMTTYAAGSDVPTSRTSYEYYNLDDPDNNKVDLMGNGLVIATDIPYQLLGKESEILSELRRVNDVSVSANVDVDVTTGFYSGVLPTALPYLFPAFYATRVRGGLSLVQRKFKTHVTSKIISYPSLLKKVTTVSDDITHTNTYEVFDINSGQAVVTRSYDDFKGTYLSQDFKGSWSYDQLGSKFKNLQLTMIPSLLPGVNSIQFNTVDNRPYIAFEGDNTCGALAAFTKGDFLEFDNQASLYHVAEVDYSTNRLWLQKSQLSQFVPNSTISSVKVIRSGYTGELSTSVGAIQWHAPDGSLEPYSAQSSLNTNDAFVLAINAELANVEGNAPVVDVSRTLQGSFQGMDVTRYAAYVPAGCTVDLSNATISNIQLRFSLVDNNRFLELELLGFKLDGCNGELVSCSTEGGPSHN